MRNSRLFSVVLLVFLIAPMFVSPAIYLPTPTTSVALTEPAMVPNVFMESMATAIPPELIRVAIYNEPNTTRPAYDTTGISNLANSSTQIATVLQAAGYQTTILDTQAILDHELLTAHFDVFVIPDNLPRESIINQVYEFWLGGGALLGLDSFAVYSCFMGILPPESAGSDGFSIYWLYNGQAANVSARHPVSKNYAIGDTYTLPPWGYAAWDWTALMGSSIAGRLTKVAHDGLTEDRVTVLAFDPVTRGGRVAHFWWDGSTEPLPPIHEMIQDAVMWLCPRPKGRIVFDLTHLPRRAIDPWDAPYSMYPGSYTDMRDEWVSRGFMVDKLYPAASGDNFTMARLAPYDLLVVNVPDYNYTIGDRTAFQNWANDGGSVLAFGDWPDVTWFKKQNHQTSMLLNPFGLTMNETEGRFASYTSSTFTMHPITEGCTSFYFDALGYVNISGPATGVWFDGPNIGVAASTYGSGRAILVADMNWIQDSTGITQANNRQSVLNMANWLCSSTARVLLYTDDIYSPNYYKTPVALALNELGVEFYLTGGFASPYYNYFNLSLYMYTWDLVIVDNPNQFGLNTYYDDLVNYLDTGGSMIFSSFDADVGAPHALFNRLGVAHASTVGSEPQVNIWDPGHDVFSMPHLFGISNFNSTTGYIDDGDKYTVFANATALAGATLTPSAGEAFLVARNDGKTLLNGYAIDNFRLDEDDSTYEDRFELWMNEIAYILRPVCSFTPIAPTDITQGQVLTFSVEVINDGLTAAVGGSVTVVVPSGLGTLTTAASVPFIIPPGGSLLLNWSVAVTGTGNYTLDFTALYHGLPGTTYSSAPFSVDVQALPAPPLPWWWWIVLLAVIIIVIVVIIIYILRKRRGPSK